MIPEMNVIGAKTKETSLLRHTFLRLHSRIPVALRKIYQSQMTRQHEILRIYLRKQPWQGPAWIKPAPAHSCWGLCFADTPWVPLHPHLATVSLFQRWSVWAHHYSLQGVCNHRCRQCILWMYMVKKEKKLIRRKCWSKDRHTTQCWKAAEQLQREGDLGILFGFCTQVISPLIDGLKIITHSKFNFFSHFYHQGDKKDRGWKSRKGNWLVKKKYIFHMQWEYTRKNEEQSKKQHFTWNT